MEQGMKELRESEVLEDFLQDDDVIDVTDDVVVFKTGKGIDCPNCGQEIGVGFGTRTVKCASCSKTLIDLNSGEREPEFNAGQMSLERFT